MNYNVIHRDEHFGMTNIHLDAFNGFFLASLKEEFLSIYYNAALNSNETIAITADDENRLTHGFATGCIKSKGFHKRLVSRNIWTFLLQGLIIAFKNPGALIRLVRNLDKISNKNDDGNYAELISIGVSNNYKGFGIGKSLIQKFEDEAKRRGCKKVALTTDYNNNEEVVAFYFSSGYKVFYEFIAYPKRKMYKLIKEL